MSETLSERLARGARIMRDTSQLKTQHPEWLLNEMADSADLLDEAADLARRVEGAPVALFLCDNPSDVPIPYEWDEAIAAVHNMHVRLVPEVDDGRG